MLEGEGEEGEGEGDGEGLQWCFHVFEAVLVKAPRSFVSCEDFAEQFEGQWPWLTWTPTTACGQMEPR